MIYIIVSGAFVAGFIVALCLRGSDDVHEECVERFERMRANLNTQINARDAEIQRLVQGQP